ncbi:hypothetical protein FOA52_000779 [Chlamydomonas sp. UWO 241]|nr:hypothetical protein FOA52_000779 [Chlamydomonas sp. UWO 241]
MASGGHGGQGRNPFDAPNTGGHAWDTSPAPASAWGAPASVQDDLDETFVPSAGDFGGGSSQPAAWHNPPQGAWMAAAAAPADNHQQFLLPVSAGASDAVVPAVVPSHDAAASTPWASSTAASVATGRIGAAPAPSDRAVLMPAGVASSGTAGPPGSAVGGSAAMPGAEDASKFAVWNIRRYRPYFNVDTQEVLWRVTSSLIGAFKPDFMAKTAEQPDLYGPFWIATTLIFFTAAAGNLSSWIAWSSAQGGAPPPPMPNGTVPTPSGGEVLQQWYSDPAKLGTSAAIFYGYAFIVSLALWFWIKYLAGEIRLVNMFCVYGYALTIFVPISALCVIPLEVVRWVLVMGATAISGGFLLMNVRKTLEAVPLTKSIWLLGTVAALHAGLGVTLKLFFFNY